MTSLTIVVGVIPMAWVSTWAARPAHRSRAVIDGPTTSTMLTLVLIPTLYVMLEERFPCRGPATESAPVRQGDMA